MTNSLLMKARANRIAHLKARALRKGINVHLFDDAHKRRENVPVDQVIFTSRHAA